MSQDKPWTDVSAVEVEVLRLKSYNIALVNENEEVIGRNLRLIAELEHAKEALEFECREYNCMAASWQETLIERDEARKDLDRANKHIKEWQDLFYAVVQERDEAGHLADSFERGHEMIAMHYDVLKLEHDDLKELHRQAKAETEPELYRLAQDLERAQAKCTRLTAELGGLKEWADMYKTHCNQVEDEHYELRMELAQAKAEIERLKSDRENTINIGLDGIAHHIYHDAEIERLKGELARFKELDETELLSERCLELMAELAEAKEHIAGHVKDHDDLLAECNELKAELAAANKLLSDCESCNENAAKGLYELSLDCGRLKLLAVSDRRLLAKSLDILQVWFDDEYEGAELLITTGDFLREARAALDGSET